MNPPEDPENVAERDVSMLANKINEDDRNGTN
jgi:hypothetical protein